MTGSLDGKVVIVTGAGAGIGLGILRQAIAAGARTIGFDRNPAGKAKVEAEGGRFVEVDVTDLDGFEAALQAVRRDEGRLDGLVNNAGVTINVPFLEMSRAQMESLWTVNQRSVLAGCQMAARIMVADGTPGALVNIGSVHARSGNPGMEGYAGTKGAISAMGRAMAWSLGPHGIRVNALCPGLTQTETVLQAMQDPATAAELCSWHATNRVSTVEDIGNAAVFLLSDLSAALTGAEIIADQGISAVLTKKKG